MLRVGPSIDWVAPRRFAITVLLALLVGVALMTLSPLKRCLCLSSPPGA